MLLHHLSACLNQTKWTVDGSASVRTHICWMCLDKSVLILQVHLSSSLDALVNLYMWTPMHVGVLQWRQSTWRWFLICPQMPLSHWGGLLLIVESQPSSWVIMEQTMLVPRMKSKSFSNFWQSWTLRSSSLTFVHPNWYNGSSYLNVLPISVDYDLRPRYTAWRSIFIVIGPVKLTFEELTMVLSQIEACLNSRQLLSLPPDNNGNEALTPSHFITGRPLEALPDPYVSFESISLLCHFQLCQALVRHVWKCWSTEYLSCLRRVPKWHRRIRNVSVGDVVLMCDDGLVSTRWPLAHVIGCTLTRMVLYVSLSWEAPLVFMSDWSLR